MDQVSPIFVFDNPRTCSQLFHAFFKNHPQLAAANRPAIHWATVATVAGPERLQLHLKQSEIATKAAEVLQQKQEQAFGELGLDISKETYEAAAKRLSDDVSAARNEGLIPFIKEHLECALKTSVILELLRKGSVSNAPPNPTALPDHLYFSIKRPVILIRHPALVLPSYWRAQSEHFAQEIDDEAVVATTMQRSARFLFESLRWASPLVIDGSDVVHRPRILCAKLCNLWGIEESGIHYEWDIASPEEKALPFSSFRQRINDSTGVIQGVEREINIDDEQVKWEKEFGRDIAMNFRSKVDADMADYEYLQQFRLQL